MLESSFEKKSTESIQTMNEGVSIELARVEIDNLIEETVHRIQQAQEMYPDDQVLAESLDVRNVLKKILNDRQLFFMSEYDRDLAYLITDVESSDNEQNFLQRMEVAIKNGHKNIPIVARILIKEKARFMEYFLMKKLRRAVRTGEELGLVETSPGRLSFVYASLEELLKKAKDYQEAFPDALEFSRQPIADKIKDLVTKISGPNLEGNHILADVLLSMGVNWSLDTKFKTSELPDIVKKQKAEELEQIGKKEAL